VDCIASILIALKQPKQHTVLSTFRLHPDEGFQREAETSIKRYVVFGCFRVINIVFRVNLMKLFTELHCLVDQCNTMSGVM